MKLTICFLLMLIVCSSCQSQEIYEPLFQCTKKLQDPYGICTHINRKGLRYEFDTREQDLSMVDRVGASWIRADWDWPNIRVKGLKSLSFDQFDQMMESVKLYNKKIFGIFSLNGTFKMSDIHEWEYYVSQTTIRYKNDVYHWEIINEADIVSHRTPGIYAKEYVSLLKIGYNAIKSHNKKAIVLFSGIANTNSLFVDSVFCAGTSQCFDIMTVHRYTEKDKEPEVFLDYFKKLHRKLFMYGIEKPVWLTETGGSTMPEGIDEQTQALRLPRIFLISFACGVEKVFWYKSRSREQDSKDINDYYGLWHNDYTPKPAFYTYQTLIKMCPDKSTRPKLVREGNVYIASWKRPDGKKAYALWTSKEKTKVDLNYKGKYTCYDLNGKEVIRTEQNVEVSPSILYFVGGRKFEMSIHE